MFIPFLRIKGCDIVFHLKLTSIAPGQENLVGDYNY